MKSRTEYVRQEWVTELRRQIVTHKRFKRLVDQWIDLSIEHSRLTMRIAEPKGPPKNYFTSAVRSCNSILAGHVSVGWRVARVLVLRP